ncbi:bifunctional (p)ppGpp synthetase/guanosine-3',5'-bis(diphosphate) 3'-pyrophosphohydrolase [Rubrivirga sp. S365]|uniref:Bifunctional (P)ppGpp synthetase/guanosine-3',5'-bis(Diphosphate) 3'-pyrophosphohydrolase n=1 Tax=Rubrivirga litoralis TaxID=3075598 RepID=A0ABU3BS12_9BACT|nr:MULTISPECIES: bifunctional (p)ppGpp synthetase/guanosine-3',5'-bis(diphosphate) 3'-pyrophosphohydrolase [unclassified Rubrivirga]MDT0632077.1 bifunctional (p)ppGpp synthetase/guanosine-3',5'-bis(diphosphate) 3'-pyrophosphohydrolase [Rubrivirga sp. F394]MDT7856155.1 bifunctional (p)ppGpp synthetase/guanosine-3',5'-bis(diphosphate) 3'-pyrophosphohydrolase [Rubrivirga sp. S365]
MFQASQELHAHLDGLVVAPEYERGLRVLIEHCRRNLPSVDEAMIRRAFRVAYWAHRDDRRASGELYISHPLEVALIAAKDIRIDDVTVAAALLHDTVEDTDLSLDLLRSEFGDEVAQITDGVTKIGSVFEDRGLGRAENVRKLMLSMASDVRVILVKFADRLHNMRTLGAVRPEKQRRIAAETQNLFAPLAHRFGLHEVKTELEDLSLKYLQPEAFQEIARGLNAKRRQRERYVEQFVEPIRAELEEGGFDFEIYGRPKSITSIYNKMQRQGVSLDEVYDLFAIRVILESTGKKGREDCWRVYSALTALYPPVTDRFRDFLSVPKSNGYQSLHTTVIGPGGRPVEIQIRTREMHEIAERGVAAHWKYKEADPGGDGAAPPTVPAGVGGAAGAGDARLDEMYAWVRDLLETPASGDAGEFVREFQLNLYDEEIYVFTPGGDLVTLPRGATPVDFAFQIHTEVGFHCIGAKADGKMVPLSYVLQSGEQVEILTSKRQTPNPDWAGFVVTHKAQSRIRHWINERRRKAVAHGRELLDKKLARAKLAPDEQTINRVSAALRFPNAQQLFFEVGAGLYDPDDFVAALQKGSAPEPEVPADEGGASPALLEVDAVDFREDARERGGGRTALVIEGERHTDLVVEYAACCGPIPGDDVFGFLSRTGAVNVHRRSCKNAAHLYADHGERVIPVEWSRQKDVQFSSTLRVVGEDRVGIVSDMTAVISKSLKTNIRSITVTSEDGMFEGTIVLYVSDVGQLKRIVKRLGRLDGIYGVYRDD